MKKLLMTVMLAAVTAVSAFGAASATGNIRTDFKLVPKNQIKTYADVETWVNNWYAQNPTVKRSNPYIAATLIYVNFSNRSEFYEDCMKAMATIYETTSKDVSSYSIYLYTQSYLIVKVSGNKLTNVEKFNKLVEIEKAIPGMSGSQRITLLTNIMKVDSEVDKAEKIKVYTYLWEKYYPNIASGNNVWKTAVSRIGLKLKSLGVDVK